MGSYGMVRGVRNFLRSSSLITLLLIGGVSSLVHAAPFSESLGIGSHGSQVASLQSYLASAGYFNGPQTGYYGSLTKVAVAEFQRDHGIQALGIVGPQTRGVLNNASLEQAGTVAGTGGGAASVLTAQLSVGSTGDQVVALQQFLKDQGFYTYPQITGFFGPLTASAVSAFQVAHGLDPVGEVGPQTRAQINTSLASSGSTGTSAPSGGSPTPTQSAPVVSSGGNHFSSGSVATSQPVIPPVTSTSTPTDTTPPTVSLTAPTTGSTVSGTSVSFNASASDDVAVTGVQFIVDGTLVGSVITSSPYTYNWQSIGVADGSHSIRAVAHDAVGNYATSSASTVTVDNTPPVRSLGSPSTALPLGTSSTTLSLTTNESATCKYSTSTGVSFVSMTNTFTSTGGTSHNTNVTGLVNGGSYAYYVRCQDGGGTVNTTDYTISFTVAQDATSPTVSITAPSNNANVSGSLAITATASDDVSVAGVQFVLDGAPLGSEEVSGPYTYTLNTTGISDGTHALTAVARDGASNYGTSTVVSIIVDNTAPTFSTISAGSPLATTTTITWTTNENATAQVQYGLTTSYGTLTTRDSSLITPHAVLLSSLTPSTTYHYKVISSDAQGNTATSTDNTFVTTAPPDTTPPIISSVSSTTATSTATILWTTNEAANSQLEYGTTGSYGTLTTLDAALVTNHSVSVNGLTASSTYHFRVRSSDASGNLATTTDYTFTTTALPDTTPPTVSSVASTTATSTASVTWTTNEPANSQVEYGTTTSYGTFSSLDASLVTNHSVGLNALTASTTYHFRIRTSDAAGNLATTSDYTFTTTPLPDTTPPTISSASTSAATSTASVTWTTNEPANSQVEYGTTSSYGTQTTLDASLVTSHTVLLNSLTASTTYHYRIRTSDAAGNLATSTDATFTTSALPDTIPPVISSVASSTATSTATVAWNTDEPADSQVEYGTTTSYGTLTTLDTALITSHSVPIASLTASTTYHFRIRTKDASANLATSTDYTFTTMALPDTTPPVISAVATTTSTSTAAITWTTDEPSNSQLAYGTTTSYGTSSTLNASLVTNHTVNLSSLSAATLYHFSVRSSDAAGNLATSTDYTFTTTALPDTTPPTISLIASSTATSTASVTWTTNELADSQLEYGTTTSYGTLTTLDTALVTNHSVSLAALTASTTYHFRIRTKDASANLATSTDYTFTTTPLPDTTPPIISSASTSVATSTASIMWTTNEPANSQVEYGTTSSYGTFTTLDSTLVTSHTVLLNSLTASTTYHYRIRTSDAAGNLATSTDYTFTTTPLPDTTPPVISSVGSTTSTTTAAITWNTDEPSSSQLAYGTTTSYGTLSTLNASLVTTHTVNLSGLSSAVTYHFSVRSSDAAGNLATSTDYTFTTSAVPDTTPPVLSAIASSTSATSVTITWTTDENSNSRIDVGTTTFYGLASTSATLLTNHSLTLTGLATSTIYHFRVQSADASGNTATSTDLTFTTTTPVPTQLLMTNRTNLMGYSGYTGSSGDTDSNSRISLFNQTGTGVTKFKLYYTGWMANSTNEQDGYNPVTISASVEYPAGTFTQVLFGGSATTSLLSTETRETDEVTLSIPSAAQFWIRTYVSVSTTSQKWVQGYTISTTRGEAVDFSTGVDKTMSGTITNATVTSTHRGFGPIAIKATGFTGTPVKRAFASVGDSILMQAGDGNFDSKGDGGWNGRALTDVYPHVNFAISGTTGYQNLPANYTRRMNALKMIGVTDILDDFGNNDLGAGRTYAQVTSDITSIVSGLQSNGFRVHHATPLPYTTSTDAWKTITNQSIYTTNGDYVGTTTSIRAQFANFIRANTIGLAGVVDIADAVDVNSSNVLTRNGGYWISGNSPSSSPSVHLTATGASTDPATVDGRHPNVTNTSSPFYGGHYILKDVFSAYLALLPNL